MAWYLEVGDALAAPGNDGSFVDRTASRIRIQSRGNRLVYTDNGSVDRFTCSYHGWQFDHSGTVIQVQEPEDFPRGNPCGKVTLTEIPCEGWAGFIWYNMDAGCVPLASFLGESKNYFDLHNPAAAKRVYYKVCEVDFNWKALHDNFCESYHLPTTHPQISDATTSTTITGTRISNFTSRATT